MRRRELKSSGTWVTTQNLLRSPGHVFYEKLNGVLERGGFDRFVKELCEPHYADVQGRPSIEPGVYFRMLFEHDTRGVKVGHPMTPTAARRIAGVHGMH